MEKKQLFKRVNDNPASVHQKVMQEIKNAILHGRLKPGDKLPPERELAEMLGVSRTSLREALKLLEISGMVNIKHGQGVFITSSNPEEYLKKILNYVVIDDEKILELFAIRKILETQAVEWACEKGTDEELYGIMQMLENTKKLLKEKEEDNLHVLAKHDSQFHYKLFSATKNRVLELIMHALLDILADSRAKAASIPGRPEKSLDEHMAIAKALIKRDEKAAKNAILKHLENVERDVFGN